MKMKKLREILLIDDDAVNNFISEKLLLKLGIAEKVVFKKNGKEGIDYIRDCVNSDPPFCPPFIIFDYNMPVMDGLEFLKQFLHMELKKQFHVVLLLLAVQMPSDLLREFLQLGIQEYTLKPLDEESVLKTYEKYWNKEGIWIG